MDRDRFYTVFAVLHVRKLCITGEVYSSYPEASMDLAQLHDLHEQSKNTFPKQALNTRPLQSELSL